MRRTKIVATLGPATREPDKLTELIAAGASAVALGTVLFSDPGAATRIRGELAAEAAARGFEDALSTQRIAHSPLQMGVFSLENRQQHLPAEGSRLTA